METACLRYTDIPGTSRLFLDFQYHFDRVKEYYGYSPADSECYASAAKRIDYPDGRREALVRALRERNGDSPQLDLLAKPGTVAVVTGQQVGLFSGPAYTIYKALTAAKLARQLTDQGQPAVPIFWLATEDHDLAEVNHAYVFGPAHQPVKVTASGVGEAQQPVGTIGLGAVEIDGLTAALSGFPFGDEVSRLVAESYSEGNTFGSSFERLLRKLLERWGFLFLDPLDHALRAIAAPFLRMAIERAPDLSRKVLARNKALVNAGYHAQVHVEVQTSFFFLLEGKRRMTLKRQDTDYLSQDRRYSSAELSDTAEQVSPNALLRPVMQDYLLPTVAYVGGPAELAYFAQSKVLYDELLGRMPVMLARSGFTLLDFRANKLMERYDLGLPCFFKGEDCLRDKIAAKLVPSTLVEDIKSAERSAGETLDRVQAALTRFDPTLAASLTQSRAKILYQFNKIQRKTGREALRRDERANEESRFLTGSLFPDKHLQERYYSILPFLAKHGFELLDTLYDSVHLDCPDHKILAV